MLLWCTKIQKIQLHIFQVPVKSVQTSSQVLQEPMPDKHHHGSHGSHSHGAHSHDSHGHPHQDSDVHEHHHNHPRDLFTADSQLSEQLTPYPQPRFYDPVSSRTLNSQKGGKIQKDFNIRNIIIIIIVMETHIDHRGYYMEDMIIQVGIYCSKWTQFGQWILDPNWAVDTGSNLGTGYFVISQCGNFVIFCHSYFTWNQFCGF